VIKQQPKGQALVSTQVIYHADCPDGWCSAWIADRHFRSVGQAARLIPARHDEPPIDLPADGSDVLLVDFSYPVEVLLALAETRHVLVLDHHESTARAVAEHEGGDFDPDIRAREYQQGNLKLILDMDRSGAMITWDHLHPGRPAPPLVQYVQDRDLWRFDLPDSGAVNAWIQLAPHTIEAWDELAGTPVDDAVDIGQHIRIREYRYVTSVVSNAFPVRVDGVDLVAVNAGPDMRSDVCQRLLGQWPEMGMAACFWRLSDGRWQWSIRSRPGVSVLPLVRARGGGGHPRAGGFTADHLVGILT
jgi:hypothetical protein